MGCVVRAFARLFNTKVYSKPQVKAEAVSGQDYGVRPEPSAPPYPADDDDCPFDDDDDFVDEIPPPVLPRDYSIFVEEGSLVMIDTCGADATAQAYVMSFTM